MINSELGEHSVIIKFYTKSVKQEMCGGPRGNFCKPQPIQVRYGVDSAKSMMPLIDATRIVACPRLKGGEFCGADEDSLHCIEPFVITSPQQLGALPEYTNITFKPRGSE